MKFKTQIQIKTLLILLTLILALSKFTLAQREGKTSYSMPLDWSNFILVDSLECPPEDKILVVTNRPLVRNAVDNVLLPNDIEEYRIVTYLLAWYTGIQWKLQVVNSFEDGMQQINNSDDIVVFVHGHGKSFPLAIMRAQQIKSRYKVATIVFDWPAKNKNFNNSLARVRYCSENFYNLLLNLQEYRKTKMAENQHLTMFCHSLGNYFISYLVVNGNHQYLQEPIFDNLILNSAAIKEKRHNEVIERVHIAKRIYINGNLNDWVLRGAGFLTTGKMLGNFLVPPYAHNAEYYDFTSIAAKEHTYFAGYHEFEHTHPAIFDYYNTTLHGNAYETNRSLYFTKIANGPLYKLNQTNTENISDSNNSESVKN